MYNLSKPNSLCFGKIFKFPVFFPVFPGVGTLFFCFLFNSIICSFPWLFGHSKRMRNYFFLYFSPTYDKTSVYGSMSLFFMTNSEPVVFNHQKKRQIEHRCCIIKDKRRMTSRWVLWRHGWVGWELLLVDTRGRTEWELELRQCHTWGCRIIS